jgi:hypothetical protein
MAKKRRRKGNRKEKKNEVSDTYWSFDDDSLNSTKKILWIHRHYVKQILK